MARNSMCVQRTRMARDSALDSTCARIGRIHALSAGEDAKRESAHIIVYAIERDGATNARIGVQVGDASAIGRLVPGRVGAVFVSAFQIFEFAIMPFRAASRTSQSPSFISSCFTLRLSVSFGVFVMKLAPNAAKSIDDED